MARVRQGLIAVTRSLRSPQWGPLHYHIHYLLAIDDKDDYKFYQGQLWSKWWRSGEFSDFDDFRINFIWGIIVR